MKKRISILLLGALLLTGCAEEEHPTVTLGTMAPETTVQTTAPEAWEAMAYQDFLAAPVGTPVCLDTWVQFRGDWWDGFVTVYCQGPEGGLCLYQLACPEEDAEKLTAGTAIRVEGYKAEYKGRAEILDGTFRFREEKPWFPIAADGKTALKEGRQSVLVSLRGVTVADAGEGKAFRYGPLGYGLSGDDIYLELSWEDGSGTFRLPAQWFPEDSEVYQTAQALEVGAVVDIQAWLDWEDGAKPLITGLRLAETEE